MNIAIFIDEPHWRYGGKVYSQFTWHQFAVRLGKAIGNTTLMLPVISAKQQPCTAESRDLDDVSILSFEPGWVSYKGFCRKLPQFICNLWKFRRIIQSQDILIIRVPSLAGFIVGEFIRHYCRKTRVAVYVGGNILSAAPISDHGSSWRRRLMARLSNAISWTVEKTVSGRVTFCTGQELCDLLQHRTGDIFPVVTGMISERAIRYRQDTCINVDFKAIAVAKLIPMKGLESLLECMSILKKSGRRITLDIIGKGNPDYEQVLKDKIYEHDVQDVVSLRGFMSWEDSLKEAYWSSDIFILPSLSEGFPRVILEAWAHGVPVVCTNVGGIPSVTTHGQDVLLVPPQAPSALATAVERILDEPSLRQSLISGGYATLKASYTSEKIVGYMKNRMASCWKTQL